MCIRVLKRYAVVSSIVLSVLGLVPSLAFATDSLYSQTFGLGAMSKAGTFDIGSGGSAQFANKTGMDFYLASDCTGTNHGLGITTGSGYTFSPNTTVNISAAGVYAFCNDDATCLSDMGGDMANVHSVHVTPKFYNGSTDTQLFTALACFVVTCNTGTGECTGTDTDAVTLIT
jgi:hypothetical protein